MLEIGGEQNQDLSFVTLRIAVRCFLRETLNTDNELGVALTTSKKYQARRVESLALEFLKIN